MGLCVSRQDGRRSTATHPEEQPNIEQATDKNDKLKETLEGDIQNLQQQMKEETG